jgi:hypothetical protein
MRRNRMKTKLSDAMRKTRDIQEMQKHSAKLAAELVMALQDKMRKAVIKYNSNCYCRVKADSYWIWSNNENAKGSKCIGVGKTELDAWEAAYYIECNNYKHLIEEEK